MTQAAFGRLVGRSTRWVAAHERSRPAADSPVAPRLRELVRLWAGLQRIIRPQAIPQAIREWLSAPNPAFDMQRPIDLVARGEADRVWEAIYRAGSGNPA